MKRASTVSVLICIVALVAACRNNAVNPGTTDTTAISGLVLKGPIFPVARIGIPNTAPLAGATIAIANSSGSFNATVVSDSAGKFYIKVAADTYQLTPQQYSNSGLPRPGASVTSIVPANTTVYDTLNYDTGIR